MIYEGNKLTKNIQKAIFDITYIPQGLKQWLLNKQNLLFNGQSVSGGNYQCDNAPHVMAM